MISRDFYMVQRPPARTHLNPEPYGADPPAHACAHTRTHLLLCAAEFHALGVQRGIEDVLGQGHATRGQHVDSVPRGGAQVGVSKA